MRGRSLLRMGSNGAATCSGTGRGSSGGESSSTASHSADLSWAVSDGTGAAGGGSDVAQQISELKEAHGAALRKQFRITKAAEAAKEQAVAAKQALERKVR